MQRNCDNCGQPYEAKRSTSKFCKTACRMAAHNHGGGSAVVVDLVQPEPERPALVLQVEAELRDAGRLDTAKGSIALAAAERLGRSKLDGAASYAALVKELRATLNDALAGAEGKADLLDELRARRARRGG